MLITQDGDSALMMAFREGSTEVVPLLLKAGANTDLQNKVKCQSERVQGGVVMAISWFGNNACIVWVVTLWL